MEVLSTVSNLEASGTRIYATAGTLHLTLSQPVAVQVYNIMGRLVRTLPAPAGETTLSLPTGIYIVRVGTRAEKIRID